MTMKLGRDTGSVTNHLYSRATIGQPEPVVGMGATILCWTDRHAATIQQVIKLKTGVIVGVTRDDFTVIKGSQHDGSAEYSYTTHNGRTREHYRFEPRRGCWTAVAFSQTTRRWRITSHRNGLRIGERDHYYDPCF